MRYRGSTVAQRHAAKRDNFTPSQRKEFNNKQQDNRRLLKLKRAGDALMEMRAASACDVNQLLHSVEEVKVCLLKCIRICFVMFFEKKICIHSPDYK
jgi:hypothetical protein